jgi:3-deoxy-D-manno-octulosonic-acid transferase
VLPVIEKLLEANPSAHVLLTTGTLTSAGLAARRLPPRAFHQFIPLDAAAYAARFLEHWHPDLAVFTESEIWPNLILETSKRKIPLALINARMSPRSQKRWRRNSRLARPLFSRFNIILAQNDRIARTVTELGAPVVINAGNLKIDSPPPPVDSDALAALKAATEGRPIFLAASTHPGEDGAIAAAHSIIAKSVPRLLTIIVPRHPDRGPALIAEMTRFGHKTERRSLVATPAADTDVYIADTIGELGTFYALAPVSFIGGSLIEHGGQNPIEAIRHGSVVLTGPSQHNFRDIFDVLIKSGGAIEITGAEPIAAAVTRLLADPSEMKRQRGKAQAALGELTGALEKTLNALQPFLAKQRV